MAVMAAVVVMAAVAAVAAGLPKKKKKIQFSMQNHDFLFSWLSNTGGGIITASE